MQFLNVTTSGETECSSSKSPANGAMGHQIDPSWWTH